VFIEEIKGKTGYVDSNEYEEVVVAADETADGGSYDFNNYKTEITLKKVNAADTSRKIHKAEFTVYTDVNANGTYDEGVDEVYTQTSDDNTKTSTMTETGDGIYSMTGLPFGNYLVKETTAPVDDGFTYKLDENYYPVTLNESSLSFEVTNDGHNFSETFEYCKITLTKRICVDELGDSTTTNNIWYEHGTPTFIVELNKLDSSGNIEKTYRHSFEFTSDYVNANIFTENGKRYVEMSYTWKELVPGNYTADEIATVRYLLNSTINLKYGTYDKNTQTVKFEVASDQEGKATFYNVKKTYKDYSDNAIVVNEIQ
jgi:hypothetical protein